MLIAEPEKEVKRCKRCGDIATLMIKDTQPWIYAQDCSGPYCCKDCFYEEREVRRPFK